jgi:hypothetical protein
VPLPTPTPSFFLNASPPPSRFRRTEIPPAGRQAHAFYFFLKVGEGYPPCLHGLENPRQGEGVPPLTSRAKGRRQGSGRGQGQARVRPGGSEVRQRSAQPGGQAFSKVQGRVPSEQEGTRYEERGASAPGRKWLRCSHEAVLKTHPARGGGLSR